ncbi:aldo/keto reductase family domain-containing protein [Phthorimaea operculella]|nr:aldo/keto reductase family domain-containing protein [Phthorimaea operculella]
MAALVSAKKQASSIEKYQNLLYEQNDSQLTEEKAAHKIQYEASDLGYTFYLNDGNMMPTPAYNTSLGHMDEPTRILPENHKLARIIQHALFVGYRHLDTASVYRTETEIGLGIHNFLFKNLQVKREDLFISTKLWNDSHERKEVIPALTKSLQRLKLEYVDLYLIHFPFAYSKKGSIKMTDYVETWRGMQDAKLKGLTRSIGVANFNLKQMKRLWDKATIKPAVLQIEVNPTMTQTELVDWCIDRGIVVMGYSPFGAIFKDHIPHAPPIHADHPLLRLLSQKYKKTPQQILLRYLLDRSIVPLPRTKNKLRIRDNMNIFDFNMAPQEVAALSALNHDFRLRPSIQWYPHPLFPFEKDDYSELHIKHVVEHSKDH